MVKYKHWTFQTLDPMNSRRNEWDQNTGDVFPDKWGLETLKDEQGQTGLMQPSSPFKEEDTE